MRARAVRQKAGRARPALMPLGAGAARRLPRTSSASPWASSLRACAPAQRSAPWPARRSPHPRALCGRRSASHACGQRRRVVRRAESRRARCVRGRRALVVCARSPRAGGRQLTEPSGERARSTLASVLCATLKSLSQTRKTEAVLVSPRRQQTLQWSASARRAPQVVLRFEKPPAFLSHRLVQLRLDRWQRKASRRIRDHRGWTPRRPALRRTPPNHHAGASSQRVSRCTPDGQRAPMAAWARRAPWPACRYEAQLLGRGAP